MAEGFPTVEERTWPSEALASRETREGRRRARLICPLSSVLCPLSSDPCPLTL
ncbi:MAG: hypothetical protein LBD06_11550 [Candidatus Accumulibacter sp.]|nr:hypothetical protein [Accumulibacter sp.]